jgi:hypothetical protein
MALNISSTHQLTRRLINRRILTQRYFSTTLDIPSDGPPPVGQVSSKSIPKHLRSYDKVFQVRCVVFDFSLLVRDTPIKELVPHAQLISGFDPRHDRFQSSAPIHNARSWVEQLSGGNLMQELQARQLNFEGDDGMLRERLLQNVKTINDKWVNGLFGREIREELKDMGLESQGEIDELHDRLSSALLQGIGKPAKHYQTAVKNASVSSSSSQSKSEGSSTSTSQSSPPKTNNVYPESQLPKELTDITTKYRKKLLAKTGGSLSSLKLSNEPGRGDAEGLNIGRKALVGANQKVVSKWLPDSNVGDLLAYLDSRSMKICLLPNEKAKLQELETFKSHFPGVIFLNPEKVLDTFKENDGTVGGLHKNSDENSSSNSSSSDSKSKKGMFSGFFGSLFGTSTTTSKSSSQINKLSSGLNLNNVKSWEQCIKALSAVELDGMETGRMVVVSDNNELLQAGRELSCYTVAFNPPNQRKVDISCDFSAELIFDVKDFVEQENGISFRK